MEKKMEKRKKLISYIGDIIVAILVIPIVFVSIIVIYKSLRYPTQIPDIFTYKPFIILDEEMESSLEYGDLAITQIVDTNTLKTGDVVAFRNNDNFVILHKIKETQETNDGKTFIMQAFENEFDETKYVNEKNVEGKLVNRIAGLGIVFMYLQDPKVLLLIIIIILIIGVISYYIAAKLDERDEKQEENNKPSV